MVLTKTNNEAFLPLLEDYLNSEIFYPDKSTILKYHSLVNQDKLRLNCKVGYTISIGLDSYYGLETTYLFIWEVRDVITLCQHPEFINKDTIIICNLETHMHELILLGFQVESVYQKLGRNIPVIERKIEIDLLLQNKSGILINPTSNSGLEILQCKAFVKYRENAFVPTDTNYSNEFCEVYQMAAILGIDVYTATNEFEIEIIKNHVKKS